MLQFFGNINTFLLAALLEQLSVWMHSQGE